MDSDKSSSDTKPTALSLPLKPRVLESGFDFDGVRAENSSAWDMSKGNEQDFLSLPMEDLPSPTSKFFDGHSMTSVYAPSGVSDRLDCLLSRFCHGPSAESSFQSMPHVSGSQASEMPDEQQLPLEHSHVLTSQSVGALHPVSSGTFFALPSKPSNFEQRQSQESAINSQPTSTALGHLDSERPVAVFVDLSVFRETEKGRHALLKLNGTSSVSQTNSTSNRLRAQKRNP
jgi:hypothetical protein